MKPQMINGFPRRAMIEKMTPMERRLRDDMIMVEALGAHPRLTDAVVLLESAREAVADWVEESGYTERVGVGRKVELL